MTFFVTFKIVLDRFFSSPLFLYNLSDRLSLIKVRPLLQHFFSKKFQHIEGQVSTVSHLCHMIDLISIFAAIGKMPNL